MHAVLRPPTVAGIKSTQAAHVEPFSDDTRLQQPPSAHLVPLVGSRVEVGGGKVAGQLCVSARPAADADARAARDGGLCGGEETCGARGRRVRAGRELRGGAAGAVPAVPCVRGGRPKPVRPTGMCTAHQSANSPNSQLVQPSARKPLLATATWQLVQPVKLARPSTGPVGRQATVAAPLFWYQQGVQAGLLPPGPQRSCRSPLTHKDLAVGAVGDLHLAGIVQDEHAAAQSEHNEWLVHGAWSDETRAMHDSSRRGTFAPRAPPGTCTPPDS